MLATVPNPIDSFVEPDVCNTINNVCIDTRDTTQKTQNICMTFIQC